jgi:uncharacterized protein (TIGR02301 family)
LSQPPSGLPSPDVALAGSASQAHTSCRMQRPRKALILAVVLTCLATPVIAQDQPGASEAPASYDVELQRLAEILGALQYLRTVCNSKDGDRWRDEMQALLEAEAPAGERHRKIVANYNRGYHGYQQTYRTCTPAADLAIRRYLQEGARVARDITARYAN